MSEPFEVAAHQAVEQRATDARRTTLARAEHVWLRVDALAGPRWLPAVLTGWRRDGSEWRGHVLVVMLSWDHAAHEWVSRSWEEWALADRIVSAGSVAPDGSDPWQV